jgi:ABC-type transport system involved in multi-copper enzyme maturation permease subunit
MTTATTVRAKSALPAIVVYTLRACLPRKRRAAILVPTAASLLLGLIASSLEGTAVDAFAAVASGALFGLVMPVTCLVVGDAVLGAEMRSGTFAFTWLAPVPTWKIVLGRWLGGSLVAGGCLAIAFALAAVLAGAGEIAGWVALAGAFGAQAYIAVFLAIGCITKRAAVWSLAYVFIVERLVGTALAGIAQLSPTWEARAAFLGLSHGREDFIREGIPHGNAALVRLGVIAAVALVLASTRLRHLRLTGSAD